MRRWACNVWLFLSILCRNLVHLPQPVSDKEKTMFCTECGREFKEGAKFCEGCGKSPGQRDIPKQNGTGWRMIALGVILIGLGLYFAQTAAHDIRLADESGGWWLISGGRSLGELYAYEVGGIVGIILGVIVGILGLRKVI